jgi:AhpD family alkylhydroperoxidase
MSRITPLNPAEATGQARELLDAVQASLGATPNMTRVMARSSVLSGWLGLTQGLATGTIPPALAEQITLGVAETNGCGYCLSAHTYLGTNVANLSDPELESARSYEAEDPAAAAILSFARAVAEGQGKVSDAGFAAARAAGLSDAELADTVGHVALNVLTNYFNKAFDVDIDFPRVETRAHSAA